MRLVSSVVGVMVLTAMACGDGSSVSSPATSTVVNSPQQSTTPPAENSFSLISVTPDPGSLVREGDTIGFDWTFCQVDPSLASGMAYVRDDGRTFLQTTELASGPACHTRFESVTVSPLNILSFAQGYTLDGRFVMGAPPLGSASDFQVDEALVVFSVEVPLGYRFE